MLTQETLKSLLYYHPETGEFYWIVRRNGTKCNQMAGSINSTGYIRIKINAKLYSAHRLAWLYMTGTWPKHDMDHINRVRSDNRWCNLRLATSFQNGQNRSLYSNNTTGFSGVYFKRADNKFEAAIQVKGKRIHLGKYKSPLVAALAYSTAKKKLHKFSPIVPTGSRLKKTPF